MNNPFKFFADLLRQGNMVVFSGAGMSTESGLRDFRSEGGLWDGVDPMKMASVDAMISDYDQFLKFYKTRLIAPQEIKPNAGHLLLAKWEKLGLVDGIITQNVDGLHQKAGSSNVALLHGQLEPVRCQTCAKQGTKEDFMSGRRCSCGGRLRPGVVLFGEMLPETDLNMADYMSRNCKTFVVLGSSLVVSPANYFPHIAKRNGSTLIIVNKDETPLDDMADLVVHQCIGEFLQNVDALL